VICDIATRRLLELLSCLTSRTGPSETVRRVSAKPEAEVDMGNALSDGRGNSRRERRRKLGNCSSKITQSNKELDHELLAAGVAMTTR
jgi:hypothetical protein